VGIPEKGIAPGTRWEDIPYSFVCPSCKMPKSVFKQIDAPQPAPEPAPASTPEATPAPAPSSDQVIELGPAPAQEPEIGPSPAPTTATAIELGPESQQSPELKPEPPRDQVPTPQSATEENDLRELSPGEISAICANLAKGCEKQRLLTEMQAFNKIADYYLTKATATPGQTLSDAALLLDGDLSQRLPAAVATAQASSDRGAQRSLVWSEKVSLMTKNLLERFALEGDALLENTKVFVCDICGFIYIGDTPPDRCPVCKVPRFKITQVERR